MLLPLSMAELRAAGRLQPGYAVHLGLVDGGDAGFTREGVDVMPWAGL